MSEEKYADYVEAVQKECPDADAKEIAEAFAKYEQEFYIPPQDAMRSCFAVSKAALHPPQVEADILSETKKVAGLSELVAVIVMLKLKSPSSRTTFVTK